MLTTEDTESTEAATPETDAAERMAFAQEYMVPTDFARKLERERDEAREALHNIRINLGEDADGFTLLHAVCALQNERDEAREELHKMRGALNVIIGFGEGVFDQMRDNRKRVSRVALEAAK